MKGRIPAKSDDIAMKGASVSLQSGFVPHKVADALFTELRDGLSWEQPVIKMFGKTVNSPRLHAWYGDAGTAYRWSGRTWQPQPWHRELLGLRAQLEAHIGTSFNSCLANLYRDGNDAMGLHADDESELGPQPVIASLSFGVAREILFRRKNHNTEKKALLLEHGSLLVMSGETQTNWKHEIRRSSRIAEERINLTFRYIHPRSTT